jgi:hypothetical protein
VGVALNKVKAEFALDRNRYIKSSKIRNPMTRCGKAKSRMGRTRTKNHPYNTDWHKTERHRNHGQTQRKTKKKSAKEARVLTLRKQRIHWGCTSLGYVFATKFLISSLSDIALGIFAM